MSLASIREVCDPIYAAGVARNAVWCVLRGLFANSGMQPDDPEWEKVLNRENNCTAASALPSDPGHRMPLLSAPAGET